MADDTNVILPPEYLPDTAQQQATSNVTSDGVYADMLTEKRVLNVIQQINPDTILEDIEQRLKGMKKDPLTGLWVPIASGQKNVSPVLIANFVSFLGSILNQNTTFSNFQPEEINSIMEMIIGYVADDLDVNAEGYGIGEDYVERTRVGMIICSTVFTVLKRAQGGAESKRIFDSLNIRGTLDGGQSNNGSLEALKFWK